MDGCKIFFSKKYVSNYLDLNFSKKLEDHKHELSQVTDYMKFDHSRKLQDFNKYTTRKHEVYSELYRLVNISEGNVGYLGKLENEDMFKGMSEEVVKIKLKDEYELPEELYIKEITPWRTDGEFQQRLYIFIRDASYARAVNSISKAKNEFLICSLFLSEGIEKKVEELLSVLENHRRLYLRMWALKDANQNTENLIKEIANVAKSNKEVRNELKVMMRNELKIGYYNEADRAAQ